MVVVVVVAVVSRDLNLFIFSTRDFRSRRGCDAVPIRIQILAPKTIAKFKSGSGKVNFYAVVLV